VKNSANADQDSNSTGNACEVVNNKELDAINNDLDGEMGNLTLKPKKGLAEYH
jgi:hypothetical protein